MNFHRLKQALTLSLFAILTACGSTPPTAVAPGGSGYLLTVNLEASDTREAVAQRYGGEVLAWMDDKAILKMSEEAVAQMQARGVSLQNTTLDPNTQVATPATMQGWNAWGSGWNAWGSGWNAWGSGWNAWGSGTSTIPTLPSSNRAAFMQIKLPQAQAVARNFGSGIKVAVIDTGLDIAHPMFTGRLAPSAQWKDYVDGDANPQEVSGGSGYGHGTAVAGLILQAAPRATILPIRVLGSDGSGSVDNVVAAIEWARLQGAQIINLSLGTNVDVAALKTQISYVNGLGIFVIASAGNSGGSLTFPAASAQSAPNSDKLWSVGSINSSGSRSSFSSFGSALKFMAPGEGIQSAYPGSQVATVQGTSFAAPIISGILALAMSETASTNWNSLQFWLSNSTSGAGSTGSLFGVVNAASYLQKLPGFQRKNALLVVGATPLSSSDSAIQTRLQDIGYNVTLVLDTNTTDSILGYHLVVISPSTDSSQITDSYRSVTVPVVVMNRSLYDDMGMVASGAFQSTASQTQVAVNTSGHPLTAGYMGNTTVYSSSTSLQSGTPNSNAVNVATVVGIATRSAIFGYNTGANMVGLTAPARRVGFFIWTDGATKWSTVGGNLFEAAITWAISGN